MGRCRLMVEPNSRRVNGRHLCPSIVGPRRMFFHGGNKYCHNGGMASPTITASVCRGVQHGDDGPFPRSPETAVMQGKVRGVHDSRPLGSGMDSSAFFLLTARS